MNTWHGIASCAWPFWSTIFIVVMWMAVIAQHWWPHHASQRHHKVFLTGRCASSALPDRRHIQLRKHIQHLMAAVNTIKMFEPSYKSRCTQLTCVARTKYENEYECFLKKQHFGSNYKIQWRSKHVPQCKNNKRQQRNHCGPG